MKPFETDGLGSGLGNIFHCSANAEGFLKPHRLGRRGRQGSHEEGRALRELAEAQAQLPRVCFPSQLAAGQIAGRAGEMALVTHASDPRG